MAVGFAVAWGVAVLVEVVGPVALALWFARRYRVRALPFVVGAGVFIVFQVLTRVPAVQVLGQIVGPRLMGQAGLQVLYLLGLAFTAGLFESVGRWVGYRWLFRSRLAYSWENGAAYGIGHGGAESAILVGLNQAVSFGLVLAFTLLPADRLAALIPAELLTTLGSASAQLAGTPWYLMLMGAYERVATLVIHVGLSLLVMRCFTRHEGRWLWVAIGLHTLLDFSAPGMLSLLGWPAWVVEAYVTLWAVAAGTFIVRSRREAVTPGAAA